MTRGIERMGKGKKEIISEVQKKELLHAACRAREKAYTPYSHFQVGAALLAKSGVVYTGCNVENAAFSPTNCAERTAFFKAVSEGEREFSAIAVVGGAEGVKELELCPPCGVCRQVMMEFCKPEMFLILLGNDKELLEEYTLEELLPLGFGPENMA